MWFWLFVPIGAGMFLTGIWAAVSYNQYCPLYGYESRAKYAIKWALYRWLIWLGQSFCDSLLDGWDCLRGRETPGWTIVSMVANFFRNPWHINHGASINHQRRQNQQAVESMRR